MNPCSYDILIGRYHDGELNALQKADFESHLASCPRCAAHLADLNRVAGLIARLPLIPLSPLEHSRINRVFDGLEMRLAERAMMRMAISLAALAATLLLVTSLWLAGVGRTTTDASPENIRQIALLLPQTPNPPPDQARSNLSHWMVRNLGGDQP